MACDKVVCERWCVWQSCVWKRVCDKAVCERCMCVCERECAKESVWPRSVWRERGRRRRRRRRKRTGQIQNKNQEPQTKMRHAKCRWTSPSATPAMQSATAPRATNGDQARHRSQPSVKVPRLPRKCDVHVAKRRACHAKCKAMSPSAVATRSAAAPRATKRATGASAVS